LTVRWAVASKESLAAKVESHAGFVTDLNRRLEIAEQGSRESMAACTRKQHEIDQLAQAIQQQDELHKITSEELRQELQSNAKLTEQLSQADEKLAAMALQPTVEKPKKRAAKKLETKKKKAA
jgi:hypothetical protein